MDTGEKKKKIYEVSIGKAWTKEKKTRKSMRGA